MKKALVLSLALVLGLGFATFAQGAISGEWNTTIKINPGAPSIALFFDFTTSLDVTYSIGGWDFTSHTVVDDTGWKSQSFDADGTFGAFGIESTMVFGTAGTFTSWAVDTSFTFGSVLIGFDFDLGGTYGLTLGVSGTATTGLVDITIDMLFGALGTDCDLDWQGVDITVDFPFNCAEVTATLDIDCAGFKKACFAVSGIDIPNLPWVDIDAKVCFELQTKTLVLTPKFSFGADVCFDLYICQAKSGGTGPSGGSLVLGDIYIAGIGLDVEIGGVSFTGISYWGTDCAGLKPKALGNYWEMYKIATTEQACCGPFDFDVAVFFDAGSAYLFDVAAFEANFSYELGDNFTFSMGLDYTAAAGLTLWTIGFEITW
jgi:hypothetical protein